MERQGLSSIFCGKFSRSRLQQLEVVWIVGPVARICHEVLPHGCARKRYAESQFDVSGVHIALVGAVHAPAGSRLLQSLNLKQLAPTFLLEIRPGAVYHPCWLKWAAGDFSRWCSSVS